MFSIRPELFHPMVVHFPIVFIVLSFALQLVRWGIVFVPAFSSYERGIVIASRVCLYLAVVAMGAALFSGDVAEDVAKKALCDLKTLSLHDEQAHLTLYFLLGALATDSLEMWGVRGNILKSTRVGTWVCLILANFLLIQTAHHGAMLVYEQGAAVNLSAQKCGR